MNTHDYFKRLLATWTKDDCLAYFASQSEDNLKDGCHAILMRDFDDCKTGEDVEAVGRMEFLRSPSNYEPK